MKQSPIELCDRIRGLGGGVVSFGIDIFYGIGQSLELGRHRNSIVEVCDPLFNLKRSYKNLCSPLVLRVK